MTRNTMRTTLFAVFVAVYVVTCVVTLYAFLRQAGALGGDPRIEVPHLKLLLITVIVETAAGVIGLFCDLLGLRGKAREGVVEPVPDIIERKLINCSVQIRKGDLIKCHSSNTTVVYPVNVFFDTTDEQGVVDKDRSTWGQYLKRRVRDHHLRRAKLDGRLDEVLDNSDFREDTLQEAFDKPGRHRAFRPGSAAFLEFDGDRLILLASARLLPTIRASMDEAILESSLEGLWEFVSKCPGIHDLCLPLIGAGFGRIRPEAALARLLLSLVAAVQHNSSRPCERLIVIVHRKTWGDGAWVSSLIDALFGRGNVQ